MDADHQLALELMVCRAYQLPHSTFLGWSKDDRDKALWEFARSVEKCPSCRTREAEWAEGDAGGDRNAYRAEKARCRGCEVLEYARETVDEKRDGKGIYVRLVRNGRR
jgi:hypothetical protein